MQASQKGYLEWVETLIECHVLSDNISFAYHLHNKTLNTNKQITYILQMISKEGRKMSISKHWIFLEFNMNMEPYDDVQTEML